MSWVNSVKDGVPVSHGEAKKPEPVKRMPLNTPQMAALKAHTAAQRAMKPVAAVEMAPPVEKPLTMIPQKKKVAGPKKTMAAL
jgi:hypothetical protein